MKHLLEVEKKPPLQVTDFATVEKTLRSLKSYGPHSYASLTKQDGSYLQVAGGGMTCILEMRNRNTHQHFRAYLPEPHVPFKGKQTLIFGGGQLKMRPDEILTIDKVVVVFREYFNSVQAPDSAKWRNMSSMFDNI